MHSNKMEALSTEQINSFIDDGFIKLEQAFPAELANECCAILWKATGCNPDNRDTWTQPVIRIAELSNEPFIKAANTLFLHNAFDQLAEKNNWLPRVSMGSFPIRFPHQKPAGDTGWHVDASFPGDDPNNYFNWRINIHSKGRALLMLFLFSDVSSQDAPTIIKKSSHKDVAKILEPEGEKGISFFELAQQLDTLTAGEEIQATGKAGTVYLCHPFIVHAAQDHHGSTPKFMAQPPLLTKGDFNIRGTDHKLCPVEQAIVQSLKKNQ